MASSASASTIELFERRTDVPHLDRAIGRKREQDAIKARPLKPAVGSRG